MKSKLRHFLKPSDRRTIKHPLAVSPSEMKFISKAADACFESRSEFIRNAAKIRAHTVLRGTLEGA